MTSGVAILFGVYFVIGAYCLLRWVKIARSARSRFEFPAAATLVRACAIIIAGLVVLFFGIYGFDISDISSSYSGWLR